jgi:GMP synthase (glutamine-hydrolysing)
MRIQLIEHDPEDFSRTNITLWATEKKYQLKQIFICNNEALPALDSFDWLMIMGGSQHAWDIANYPWIQAEKDFLLQALGANKIVVGVCFGAQLLAEALGGRIFSAKHKEIGWHDVKLNSEGRTSFLFNQIPDAFTTFHWHSDHFSLPNGCIPLASSKATENQAFVCRQQPVVGLQFHPEYTLDMVRYYARNYSQDWLIDTYVQDGPAVLARTDELPGTYTLMKVLLNNIAQEFAEE